jgi:hypothetical protein
MAHRTTVIIPIGAMPSRISSPQPIEVARNCLVKSSPNNVSSGAKLLKALFAKFPVSTLRVAIGVADVVVVVDMTERIQVYLSASSSYLLTIERQERGSKVQEEEGLTKFNDGAEK